MERRLAAILAADVVGYSKLMADDQQGTLAALRQFRSNLFDPAVKNHRGNLVKSMGDGWLVEFPSVSDAVECAVVIQNDLDGFQSIQLRVGIHTGEVIFEDEDVFGDGVNVAARLEKLAEPGQIAISDNAHQSLDGKTGRLFSGGAAQALKNIPRPVGVWYWPEVYSTDEPAVRPQHFPPTAEGSRLSIVVLPIVDLSADADQDYFVDALGEDLTTDLSRISDSFVVARGTAATYRGLAVDPMVVSQELDVRYVLEGKLRFLDSGYRVNMELTDGYTGQQIWAERYEKSTSEMYRFQDEVTGRIARTLNLELKEAVSRQAGRSAVANIEAADLAIRAWAELWTKPQTQSTNDAAFDFANRALDIDQSNAEANASVAYAYARAALYGWLVPRETAIKKGICAAEKSLQTDSKCADAAYALALLQFAAGENFYAQEIAKRCLELNRNHAPAIFLCGLIYLRLGKPQDSVSTIEQAFALSPREPLRAVWHAMKARAHFFLDDHLSAIREAQKSIAANRDHAHSYSVLAAAFAALNRMEEAKNAGREFERRLPGITVDRYISEVASDDPLAKASYEPLRKGLLTVGLPP